MLGRGCWGLDGSCVLGPSRGEGMAGVGESCWIGGSCWEGELCWGERYGCAPGICWFPTAGKWPTIIMRIAQRCKSLKLRPVVAAWKLQSFWKLNLHKLDRRGSFVPLKIDKHGSDKHNRAVQEGHQICIGSILMMIPFMLLSAGSLPVAAA